MSGHDETGRHERLSAYVAGEMTDDRARAFEREILSDDDLADSLYADVNLVASMREVAARRRAIVPTPHGWQRWSVRIVVPLAAAAALAIIVLPSLRSPHRPSDAGTFRGAAETTRLLSPVGDMDALPSRFVWTPTSDASMYRLELYDGSARLRFRTTTTDTSASLPEEGIGGEPFDAGYWKVIPMNDAGVELPGPPPASIRVR